MYVGRRGQAKKLTEAAEHWCGPLSGSTKALADDLEAFGLPDDAFGPVEEVNPNFEVFEENWETVQVFIFCQTQWRKEIPGMGGEWIWHGLRYPDCESVIRNLGFKGQKAKDIFIGLMDMERAALPILNKPKK